MSVSVAVPANLPELVRAAFVRAQAAGDLTFFPTQVALLHANGIPFQLRFAPSLAQKPKPTKPKTPEASSEASPAKAFDPFADPPPGLLVAPQIGPAHRLVLNKFAICRDHAILATTDFRPQHHLLAADDLAAAYACVETYHCHVQSAKEGEELFVFYNSGTHSGASQPHRHLQMLPVARMREGLPGTNDASAWKVMVDQLGQPDGRNSSMVAESTESTESTRPPFFIAASPVRGNLNETTTPSSAELHALYLRLYRDACSAVGLGQDLEEDEELGRIPARISYNLALTRTTMALCPRLAEGGIVASATASADDAAPPAGQLSLNGTVLAGTALVKNEAEWTALRQDPGQLTSILSQIGVPIHVPSTASL